MRNKNGAAIRKGVRRSSPARGFAGTRASRKLFIRELRADHALYSRILSMISREVNELPSNPRSTLALLVEAFEFIVAYFDGFHHAREDELYRQLARHSRSSANLLASLGSEHELGVQASGRILRQLHELSGASIPPRLHALAQEVDGFVSETRAHIGLEERLMYSRRLRVLSAADWRSVESLAPTPGSGVRLERSGSRYPLLSRYLGAGGTRYVPGSTHGVLEGLGIDTAGAAYGRIVGRGVQVMMLAGGQAREAVSLALHTACTLLTPRLPLSYVKVARRLVNRNVGSLRRWSDEWRDHLRLGTAIK